MVTPRTVAPAAADVERARLAASAAIESARDDLVELSRYIHQHPEPAMKETLSSAACADFLERNGFTVERGTADLPTAFTATAGTPGGRRIGFLAEYDALPGLGHGCGHNLIAMANIAAGLGLRAGLAELGQPGQVVVFGTPAEEAISGKAFMVDAGAFDDVDVAMGAHPGPPDAVCPTVEGSGQALACQAVRIEYRGQSAHAAADPYNGINALNAIIEVFNGINALRQHVRSDARFHGVITDGGHVPNVVPDFAAADFFVRAQTMVYMNELVEKVRRIAEGAALITGAELSFDTSEKPSWDMITNHTLARAMKRNIDAVGLELPEARAQEGNGSTDWGNVSYVVPSVETSYPIIDRMCTWHSQDVVDASDSELGYANTLLIGQALAMTGVDIVTDDHLLATIRAEFDASRATGPVRTQ
ncbi:MAG TPA: M20 family metallopeptidase [Thermomicrobiales bacterium]|jgi:amidohydrolase|nr:M20 family metallopeptidase [Thermomicrobiales bacterium]